MIVPGDLVIKSNEYMKGHNTYTTEDLRPEVFASEENQKEDEINIYSSTLGVISKINKLISIENVNKKFGPWQKSVIISLGKLLKSHQPRNGN